MPLFIASNSCINSMPTQSFTVNNRSFEKMSKPCIDFCVSINTTFSNASHSEVLTNYTMFKSLFRERRIGSEEREYN